MRRVAALLPDVAVRLAFLERGPSVPDTLADLAGAGVGEVVVLPLLLTVGYHSKTDLPALLRAAPLPVRYGRVLGPDPLLAEALDDRLAEAGVDPAAPVVLAAAGSSDPDAAVAVEAMAHLLAQRRGSPVRPAYASAIRPTVSEALAVAGPGAAVAQYFLAPGQLPDRVLQQAAGRTVSEPLIDHLAVAKRVNDRYVGV